MSRDTRVPCQLGVPLHIIQCSLVSLLQYIVRVQYCIVPMSVQSARVGVSRLSAYLPMWPHASGMPQAGCQALSRSDRNSKKSGKKSSKKSSKNKEL